MRLIYAALALTSALVPSGASAAQYLVSVSATVSNANSVDRDFNRVDINPLINVGDFVSFSFVLDTNDYRVTSLYDADPTVNIYYGSVTGGDYKIGDYHYTTEAGSTDFSSTQLWNNRDVSEYSPSVDAFNISMVKDVSGLAIPTNLGSGPINLTFNLSLFDFSAAARTNDLMSQITSFDKFGSQSMSFGFINSNTYLQTSFSTTGLQASIESISAVPEPATWAMLIFGFGAVGVAMRRRKNAPLLAAAPA